MKTVSSLLALVALTVSARAGGIIDNTAEAAKLAVRRLPLFLRLILPFKRLLTTFCPSHPPPSTLYDPLSTFNATPNSFVLLPFLSTRATVATFFTFSQASAVQLNGAGDYVFTNVKTGEVLSFTRSGSTTDFFPSSTPGSLSVQVRFSCLPLFLHTPSLPRSLDRLERHSRPRQR
jgi:hypothetical protein